MSALRNLGLALLLLWTASGVSMAEDDEADDAKRVRALLAAFAAEPAEGGLTPLRALGWKRVAPHLIHILKTEPALQGAALEVADMMGQGPELYRILLIGIRLRGDGDVTDVAMQGLTDALGGSNAIEPSHPPRLTWNRAWWRDLLIEFHRTEVPEFAAFRSGPPFAAWALEEVLADHVHGDEAELTTLTRDPDWRVRMMALPFLARTRRVRTQVVADALLARLRDKHAKVRQMAVRALAQGGWRVGFEGVAARLRDAKESVAVRVEAALFLGDLDKQRAREPLLSALHGPDPRVRTAAAAGLGDVEPTAATASALLHAMRDPVASVREAAAYSLPADPITRPLPTGTTIDVPAMVSCLGDGDSTVQLRAALVLASVRRVPISALPALIAMLVYEDGLDTEAAAESRLVAEAAAEALATLGAAARPALQPLARRSRGVRRRGLPLALAVESIEMAALAREHLSRQLRGSDETKALAAAREAARRLDHTLLLEALAVKRPDVALEAAWALRFEAKYTAAVIEALLWIVPVGDAYGYRHFHTFHALGDRILPYVPRLIAAYRRRSSTAWYEVLSTVTRTAKPLADVVWREFVRASGDREIKRASALGEHLHDRVLQHYREGDIEDRTAALRLMERMNKGRPRFSPAELEALRASLPADHPDQARFHTLIEDAEPRTHSIDTELR